MPELLCHSATPSRAIRSITAEARWLPGGRLGFYYVMEGDVARVRLPDLRAVGRADELWRHTCFEAFIAGPTVGAYSEFNFAPSGEWAAYRFTGYRKGSRPVAVGADPAIAVRTFPERIELDAVVGARSIPLGEGGARLALAAVVEEEEGLSYWALAHPAQRPDFHHADSFLLPLAAVP